MRAARERPRVAVVLGWVALALVLVGALIGATASGGSGGGEREALEAARQAVVEPRTQAGQEAQRGDELAGALRTERGQVVRLRRELRAARRDLKTERGQVVRLRRELRAARRDLKTERGQVVRLRRELRAGRRDVRRGQKRNRR